LASNEYHFVTRWRVKASIQDVSDVLSEATDLPRWWPSVYLEAVEVERGAAGGVGKVVRLHTRGRLPYTLRWSFRVTEANAPHGFSLEAWGDFVGRGVWRFVQDGEYAEVNYDWRISAEKGLLRRLSFALKPLFAWNHRWAMARGEESLLRELARRAAERERVPA
jgi:hypothetical protein